MSNFYSLDARILHLVANLSIFFEKKKSIWKNNRLSGIAFLPPQL